VETEKQLAKLPKVDCQQCGGDIGPFYDLSAEVVRLNTQFVSKASLVLNAGKTFGSGRVVVLKNGVSNIVGRVVAAADV
jgi:antiviral helicase SKI2